MIQDGGKRGLLALILATLIPLAIVWLALAAPTALADSPGVAGSVITYTIGVGNLGPSRMASNLVITVTNPTFGGSIESLYSDMPGWDCRPIGFVPNAGCKLARLVKPGTITLTALIDSGIVPGDFITSEIAISSDTADPDMSNNRTSVSWRIAPGVADLYVIASAVP